MSKPSRLGRGLASLIPETALDAQSTKDTPAQTGLRQVPIDQIDPNPEQPRTVFESQALEDLQLSIRAHGILSPLVVRRLEGRYVLIAGERRLRAAALAGLTEVPVVIRNADDRRVQLELALVENLQRSDLDPIEAARGYARLIEEFGLRQEDVAKCLGKDRSTIANSLRLLKLPDFALEALRDGRISAGHARALVPLADTPDDLRSVLAKVIAQHLNVRATEALVARLATTPVPVRTAARELRNQAYDYATNLLAESLRAPIKIQPRKRGGGSIVIQYSDKDDLERLITTLRQ